MFNYVQKFGFFAIMLFASVPNPVRAAPPARSQSQSGPLTRRTVQLFDLAGLTCGHFRIPFWTFFGATAVGKARSRAVRRACARR